METNNFVPYNKTDFFFYAARCTDEKCGEKTCDGVTYDTNINSTDKDTQLCLNKNLYEKLTQIQRNHGGADQRYEDLNMKYYGDIFSIGYSVLGICIMFGIIQYA